MLNLVSTIAAVVGYNSGFFWPLLFIANAICRYNCNRLKSLFWLSLGSIALSYVFVYSKIAWSANYMFAVQAVFCGLSFAYNIYRKNWNRDYLFFWIEPVLASIYLLYLFNPLMMIQNLRTFFIIYLSLQAFVALWDLLGLKIHMQDSRMVIKLIPISPMDMLMENIWKRLQELKVTLTNIDIYDNDLNDTQKNIISNNDYINLRKKSEQD